MCHHNHTHHAVEFSFPFNSFLLKIPFNSLTQVTHTSTTPHFSLSDLTYSLHSSILRIFTFCFLNNFLNTNLIKKLVFFFHLFSFIFPFCFGNNFVFDLLDSILSQKLVFFFHFFVLVFETFLCLT